MRYLLYILSISFFFSSCKQEELIVDQIDEHFFLENDCAIMPIQVQGKTDKKTYVIMLHGGPGDSGIQSFAANGVFTQIESKFAMVYYDQRLAGTTQGTCKGAELDISQYVEDLDKLQELLRFKYGSDIDVFLMGHSWGATLGLDYLVNGARKADIKGYIHVNGSHNIPKLLVEQRSMLRQYGPQQISLGNKISEWQGILEVVETADSTSFEGQIQVLGETYKTEPLMIAADSVNPSELSYTRIISVLANSLLVVTNTQANDNRTLYEKLLVYDISADLPQVSTPIAIYWGKFDFVHPPAMARDIFSLVGSVNKELFFFEKSHHSPMAHENEAFQDKVIDFVERNR